MITWTVPAAEHGRVFPPTDVVVRQGETALDADTICATLVTLDVVTSGRRAITFAEPSGAQVAVFIWKNTSAVLLLKQSSVQLVVDLQTFQLQSPSSKHTVSSSEWFAVAVFALLFNVNVSTAPVQVGSFVQIVVESAPSASLKDSLVKHFAWAAEVLRDGMNAVLQLRLSEARKAVVDCVRMLGSVGAAEADVYQLLSVFADARGIDLHSFRGVHKHAFFALCAFFDTCPDITDRSISFTTAKLCASISKE